MRQGTRCETSQRPPCLCGVINANKTPVQVEPQSIHLLVPKVEPASTAIKIYWLPFLVLEEPHVSPVLVTLLQSEPCDFMQGLRESNEKMNVFSSFKYSFVP